MYPQLYGDPDRKIVDEIKLELSNNVKVRRKKILLSFLAEYISLIRFKCYIFVSVCK